MATPTLYWLVSVARVLGKVVPGFATITGLITLVYDLGNQMLAGVLNLAISQISAIDTSAFSEVSFATITSIGLANAVFPLAELVTIWTALFSAMGVIIAFRWIKSFVPTVSN